MFARFDENPAMTLRVIKETKRYRRTHGRTDNVKTVYPLQTKFAGGITKVDDNSHECQKKSLFVCVDALRPSQHFFNHVGTITCPPGLNQY